MELLSGIRSQHYASTLQSAHKLVQNIAILAILTPQNLTNKLEVKYLFRFEPQEVNIFSGL